CFDGLEQDPGYFFILCLEEAEEHLALTVDPFVAVIVHASDSPHDLARTFGEEQSLVGMLPERVHLGIESLELADAQRSNPGGLAGVLLVWVVDELPDGGLRLCHLDRYGSGGRVRSHPTCARRVRRTR